MRDSLPETQPFLEDDDDCPVALAIGLSLDSLEFEGEDVLRLDHCISKLESPSSFFEQDLEDTMFSIDSYNPESEAEMFSVKSNPECESQSSYDDSSTIFDDIHEDVSTFAGSEPDQEILAENHEPTTPRRSKRLLSPVNVKQSTSEENTKPAVKVRKIRKKNNVPSENMENLIKVDNSLEARVKKVLNNQKTFMTSLVSGTCTETEIKQFIMYGLDFVSGKCCALTTNSFKLHACLKLILANTLKVFDFQTRQGCLEVALLLEAFVKCILTKFTKHSTQMNSRSRRWLFAYELLCTTIHVVSDSAVLTGLEAFLLEFHLSFIKFNILSKRRPNKVSIEYRSYVSEQLSSLVGLISHRLGQIAYREKYNLLY